MSKNKENTVLSSYIEYEGATTDELGIGRSVSESLSDYIATSGQRVGIYVAKPTAETNDDVIIMPQMHDYRNEPLSMTRAQIMANKTGRTVALVETPGSVGLMKPNSDGSYAVYDSTSPLEGSRQSAAQLRNAVKGDFTSHASIQLDAVIDALDLTSESSITIYGESMGAVTGSYMAGLASERGLQLDNLVLHESVNPVVNHGLLWLVRLLRNLGGVESERRDEYFRENTEIGYPLKAFEQVSTEYNTLDRARKSLGQQGLGALANGVGMHVGLENALLDSLDRYRSRRTPRVLLTRGDDSTVSSTEEYGQIDEALQDNNVVVRRAEFIDLSKKPVGHFFLMSLGRQAGYADYLREFMDEA